MNSFNIRAPIGYRICERKESMDVDDAVQILSSKKQRKYTSACRHDQDTIVELTRHVLVCPFCGNEVPAYARYLEPIFDSRFISSVKIAKRLFKNGAPAKCPFLSLSMLNSI